MLCHSRARGRRDAQIWRVIRACSGRGIDHLMRQRMRRFTRSRLGIAVLVLIAAGAGVAVAAIVHGGGSSPSSTVAAPAAPKPTRQRSFLALVIPSPAKHLPGTDVPNRIAPHARALPRGQKVAQRRVLGFPGTSSAAARGLVRGLDVGGVVLDRDNFQSQAQLAGLVRDIRLTAWRAHDDPPLIMAPQIGGELDAFPPLPPPDAPADIGSATGATSQASDSARALDRAGLNGVIAPVLDVGP